MDALWIIQQCHVEWYEGYLVGLSALLAEAGFQFIVVSNGPIGHHKKEH
jgi:hypothetical protein